MSLVAYLSVTIHPTLYAKPAPNLRPTYVSEIIHNSYDTQYSVSAVSTVCPTVDTIGFMISRRQALWLMVLCLVVAAALRLPGLTATPPGLHYDEAANAILAGEIGQGGQWPVFIESYTGKEVLFFYLAGGLMRLLGQSTFTLRLTAAFIGLLTVAATYWLGRELLTDRRLALLAAVFLAASFWHLLFSRLGFRAISQPLLQALAIAALFRGLRRSSWPWLLAAGLFLGLAAYTYLAVRLFPLLLLLTLLPLLFSRASWRLRWPQLGLVTAVATLALLPLVAHFLAHPDSFWVRIQQAGPAESGAASLAGSYLKSLAMFFLAGDPYWRFNIPERPLMDWFVGGTFIVGWVLVCLRWFRQRADWQRSAYLLLAANPLVMILPTALAVGEIVPSNLRAIGLLPFIFFLPALGLLVLLQSLGQSLSILVSNATATQSAAAFRSNPVVKAVSTAGGMAAVAVIVLLVGAWTTERLYSQEWGQRDDLFYDSDADLVAVAGYLDNLDAGEETIYLAALHHRHPTVAFLSRQYGWVKWLPESRALVLPASGPAHYIYPHNSPAPEWAAPYLAGFESSTGESGPDGRPVYTAYRLASPPAVSPVHSRPANYSHQVTLLGYETGSGQGGESLPITLYWRVEQPAAAAWVPFVHLHDGWGYRWQQVEANAYPAEQWQPGEVIIQRIDMPLPSGLPPAAYELRVGLFDPASGQQLPVLDEAGRYAGNALSIDNVVVAARALPEPLPSPPVELDFQAGPHLKLVGYEPGAARLQAGAELWQAFWWLAAGPLNPMTIRLELIRPDNTGLILSNAQPVHNSYPFEAWRPPQLVIDHQTARLPLDLAPGEYLISLRLLGGAGETIMTTDLQTIVVEPSERTFRVPGAQYPMAATFGREIHLSGYDLKPAGKGQFHLTLNWQALTEPAADYTVFVHVLDLSGFCCVWQSDLMPRQGSYPTSQWATDEVVVDSYTISLPDDLPAGTYPVEIGLFLAGSGVRLLVEVPGLPTSDALILSPLPID
jgi:4-amino-4-deoxy-L-arabinose transferase-like glycosyltransferase